MKKKKKKRGSEGLSTPWRTLRGRGELPSVALNSREK